MQSPDLQALIELSEKASVGPWDASTHTGKEYGNLDLCSYRIMSAGELQIATIVSDCVGEHEHNAAFIAALVNWFRANHSTLTAPTLPGAGGEPFKCETCDGVGSFDERLGGEHFSNPKAKCPDCDGHGEIYPSGAGGGDALDAARWKHVVKYGVPVRNQSGDQEAMWLAFSGPHDWHFGSTPTDAIDRAIAALPPQQGG